MTVDLGAPARGARSSPPPGSTGPSPSVIVVGSHPLVGQPAPEIATTDLDGRPVRLSALRGRPVVVNFWASWCVPCREEFPLFRAAREEHAADGLEILGVVHDDSVDAARAFAREQEATWPLLDDRDDAIYAAYQVAGLPQTYYVDREGIVRGVSFGPPPSGALDEQLAKIL